MNTTVAETLEFIKENDVKFIRLAFCDLLGRQKNISIMPDKLPEAFESGISFDAHAIYGFTDILHSELRLFPDPATLSVLPWRPQQGRVLRFYCDIKHPDGSAFWGDTREFLKSVLARAEQMGYVCKVGAECEFYLFQTDENGEPTNIPHDSGGYLDVAPLDKGENVRREICLCLEEIGIKPETSRHKQGPGQNEIDFNYSDALSCADNLLTFKTIVKTIAAANGLFASFYPKPLPGKSGNGLHMNLSLTQNGNNVFKNGKSEHSAEAESFIAGILEKTPEITAFLNPLPGSYARLGEHEVPEFVSWSHGIGSHLVRIPVTAPEKVRMELRSPDPSVNPYLAFAMAISAGLAGIDKQLPLPESVNIDPFYADPEVTDRLTRLPGDLGEALELTEASDFVKEILPSSLREKYLDLKKSELQASKEAIDKSQHFVEQYFKVV